MAAQGYFPASQSWAPGTWGCGAFLGALLLCVLLVGIVIFIFLLIVKPDGTLSVIYEFRAVSDSSAKAIPGDEKTCPQCAETVKAAAAICRFCRYEFVAEFESSRPIPNVPRPIPVGHFEVGSRVMHANWGVGEVTAVDGDVVSVKYQDNRIRHHVRGALKPA